MKRENLKQKKRLASMLLFGVAIASAVLIFIQVRGLFATSSKANTLVKEAAAQSEPDAEEMEQRLADSKAIAEELKKKNLFAPPPPKQHPVTAVSGIMGDEVLISGKWYKLGDKVGDANIVAIEPTLVRIEWEGNEKAFAPIDAPIPAGPSRGRPGAEVAKGEPGKEGGPEVLAVQLDVRGGPGMGRFGNLSPEDRARMMERFRGMRERFENMSPEERERVRAEMRERFGGGPPGGGRGPSGRGGPGRGRR